MQHHCSFHSLVNELWQCQSKLYITLISVLFFSNASISWLWHIFTSAIQLLGSLRMMCVSWSRLCRSCCATCWRKAPQVGLTCCCCWSERGWTQANWGQETTGWGSTLITFIHLDIPLTVWIESIFFFCAVFTMCHMNISLTWWEGDSALFFPHNESYRLSHWMKNQMIRFLPLCLCSPGGAICSDHH